jgi:hypothetical protein
MNKHQKLESRKIKFLLKVWWAAQGDTYKRFRKSYRKLLRYKYGN